MSKHVSLRRILKILECPVCFECCEPPFYQCSSGHMCCNECRRRIQRCPICRNENIDCRALPFENMLKELKFMCRHPGCDTAKSFFSITLHEQTCPSRSKLVKPASKQINPLSKSIPPTSRRPTHQQDQQPSRDDSELQQGPGQQQVQQLPRIVSNARQPSAQRPIPVEVERRPVDEAEAPRVTEEDPLEEALRHERARRDALRRAEARHPSLLVIDLDQAMRVDESSETVDEPGNTLGLRDPTTRRAGPNISLVVNDSQQLGAFINDANIIEEWTESVDETVPGAINDAFRDERGQESVAAPTSEDLINLANELSDNANGNICPRAPCCSRQMDRREPRARTAHRRTTTSNQIGLALQRLEQQDREVGSRRENGLWRKFMGKFWKRNYSPRR